MILQLEMLYRVVQDCMWTVLKARISDGVFESF